MPARKFSPSASRRAASKARRSCRCSTTLILTRAVTRSSLRPGPNSMPSWRTRLRWLLAVVGGLLLIVLAAGVWGWLQMRGSLPRLDGAQSLVGLSASVTVERDALGVPTITGANRADVARALGYVHEQDGYFQMDLLRRRGAGELSELFGRAALDLDREARLHGFRRVAGQVVAAASPAERALL